MLNFLQKINFKQKISRIRRITVEVVIIFFVFTLIGLLNKNFMIFSDEIHYSYSYPDNSKILSPLKPIETHQVIGEENTMHYSINNQTVNSVFAEFSFEIPKTINTKKLSEAEVIINFIPQNVQQLNIKPKNYDNGASNYLTFYNKKLEELDWNRITERGLTLLQKEYKYFTIGDFLLDHGSELIQIEQSLPSNQTVTALYKTRLPQNIFISEIEKINPIDGYSSETPFIEAGITAHIFVIGSAPLDISVSKYDLNNREGPDNTKIKVMDHKQNIIEIIEIPDDGNTSNNGTIGAIQHTEVSIPNIAFGHYILDGGKNDTALKIKVNQPYLVIENDMMIRNDYQSADQEIYTLYTNSKRMRIPYWYINDTNQTLTINGNKQVLLDSTRIVDDPIMIKLNRPKKTLHKIELEKNFLKIENDESDIKYFAFSWDSFFEPKTSRLLSSNLDNLNDDSKIEYILTDYHETDKINGIQKVKILYDLEETNYINDHTLSFSLEAPNIIKTGGSYKVISIDIILRK